MTMIILGLIVGVFYLVVTIKNLKKYNEDMSLIDLSKYTKIEPPRISQYLLIGLTVLSVILLFIGLSYKNADNISLGIMLMFLGISEIINHDSLNSFYYNKTHIILNGKNIRIKSIKTLDIAKLFFVKRYKLTTLNGEEISLTKKQGEKIKELLEKNKK